MAHMENAAVPEPEAICLTPDETFCKCRSRSSWEHVCVYYVDEVRGIRKLLVDEQGNIQNFPGICQPEFLRLYVPPVSLEPRLCYSASFRKREGRWVMCWEIQQDGMYDRDSDGFGMSHDVEVVLYTDIDQNGDFTGPFRLYKLDNTYYTPDRFYEGHRYLYEQRFRELKQGTLEQDWDLIFPYSQHLDFVSLDNKYYRLVSVSCAKAFWEEPLFSGRLLEAVRLLLEWDKSVPNYTTSKIIQSCMTIFSRITDEPVFRQVLDRYYNGEEEETTVRWMFRTPR